MEVAWTGHNLQCKRRIKQQNCGSNKFLHRGGREDETDARAEHQTHWRGASDEWTRPTKLQVTVLIPGPLSVDDWLDKLGTLSHAWPQPHQLRSLQVTRVSAQAFEAARVSAAVKHLWPGLRPQWTTIYSTLRLEWPGVYDPSVLHGKFFDNVGQSDHTQDSQYQGKHWWWVFQRFRANQGVMAQRLTISEPWGFGSWQANMVEFENTLRLERAELDSCEETRKANHQYRTPHGTYRIKRTQ